MLRFALSLLIFLLSLFFYLHVHFHWKTSNDLEVFDIDDQEGVTKEKLDDVLQLRQPAFFSHVDLQPIVEKTSTTKLFESFGNFDFKVRNMSFNNENSNDEFYVTLPINKCESLFALDKQGKFISENNADFLTDSGLSKLIAANDTVLRPSFVSRSKYDVLIGSKGASTPFRYEIYHRNFFVITQGSIHVKLSPPSNAKYLDIIYDYENFEFRSKHNFWVQPLPPSVTNVKCINFIALEGSCIAIPPYWMYSFQFSEDKTSITSLQYMTYMSSLSVLPQIALYYLQNQNITRKTTKTKVIVQTEDAKTTIQTQQKQGEQGNIYDDDDHHNSSDISTLQLAKTIEELEEQKKENDAKLVEIVLQN